MKLSSLDQLLALSPTCIERFWAKVLKQGRVPDSCPELGPCWTWLGAICNYGAFGVAKGCTPGAHRVSWIINRGTIPEGLHVLHHCDIKPCVNPEHLFVGTNLDNIKDKLLKGRQNKGANTFPYLYPEKVKRGNAHPTAKITEALVFQIRKEYIPARDHNTNPQAGYRYLGNKYGVTWETIRDVIKRKNWQHT